MHGIQLRPVLGGARGARHGELQARSKTLGRMVTLPQAFLVWEFEGRSNDKYAVALLQLTSVGPCNLTAAESAQLSMWRNDKRCPPLNGEYVTWAVDWCIPLQQRTPLSPEDFLGTPGVVNRAKKPDAIRDYDLQEGRVRDRVGQQAVPLLRLPRAVSQHLSGD